MVAYLSVPWRYLKGVQQTSRACCRVVCWQWDTNGAPPSTVRNSILAVCCVLFNWDTVSVSLMNEMTYSRIGFFGCRCVYGWLMVRSNKWRNGAQLGIGHVTAFEHGRFWLPFVCMDICNEGCECVVTVVWSNPQSTVHTVKGQKNNLCLTVLLAVPRQWFVMLIFWTSWHSYWSNKCGQWSYNKNNINRKENQIHIVFCSTNFHTPIVPHSNAFLSTLRP
jgi:hypothetical protein